MKAGRQLKPWRMGIGKGYAIGLSLLLVVGIVGLVTLLTRGGSSPDAATEQATPPAVSREMDLAPDFSVRTSSGPAFTLSEHRGEPVALFFMAPGCPTCARMLPGLAEAKETFSGRGLQVLGLNLLPEAYSLEDVVEYANSLGAGNLAWAQDENAVIARSYGVQTLGETVVINRAGVVEGRFLSAVSYDTLENLVRQAATE